MYLRLSGLLPQSLPARLFEMLFLFLILEATSLAWAVYGRHQSNLMRRNTGWEFYLTFWPIRFNSGSYLASLVDVVKITHSALS